MFRGLQIGETCVLLSRGTTTNREFRRLRAGDIITFLLNFNAGYCDIILNMGENVYQFNLKPSPDQPPLPSNNWTEYLFGVRRVKSLISIYFMHSLMPLYPLF
jgi:hypothetical protein